MKKRKVAIFSVLAFVPALVITAVGLTTSGAIETLGLKEPAQSDPYTITLDKTTKPTIAQDGNGEYTFTTPFKNEIQIKLKNAKEYADGFCSSDGKGRLEIYNPVIHDGKNLNRISGIQTITVDFDGPTQMNVHLGDLHDITIGDRPYDKMCSEICSAGLISSNVETDYSSKNASYFDLFSSNEIYVKSIKITYSCQASDLDYEYDENFSYRLDTTKNEYICLGQRRTSNLDNILTIPTTFNGKHVYKLDLSKTTIFNHSANTVLKVPDTITEINLANDLLKGYLLFDGVHTVTPQGAFYETYGMTLVDNFKEIRNDSLGKYIIHGEQGKEEALFAGLTNINVNTTEVSIPSAVAVNDKNIPVTSIGSASLDYYMFNDYVSSDNQPLFDLNLPDSITYLLTGAINYGNVNKISLHANIERIDTYAIMFVCEGGVYVNGALEKPADWNAAWAGENTPTYNM